MNEAELENLCLEWFDDIGWEVLYGPDIAPDGKSPERSSYNDMILISHLQHAFDRINTHLPAECFDQVLDAVTKAGSLDLMQNNHAFHKLLLEGVPVSYKATMSDFTDEEVEMVMKDRAFLIDFERMRFNRFVAVNQFTVQGTKQLRRPDVVCFVNGLPLSVIELKSPSDETVDISDAFNQLQTYKDDVAELFVCNEALVISDGWNAKIGSLSANEERFSPWRTIQDENDRPVVEWQLETLVRGFFNREMFLDYLRFFILFESDGESIIKKIAGYHQFHAVREAVQATIIAAEIPENTNGVNDSRASYLREVVPGCKKAGVVWHTQGAGKSISMCCYAGKLLQQPEMKNPTIVVVTDRNDLDGQLYETFCNAQDLLKQTPVQSDSREVLRRLLSERESGGIIFTTVQKFALLDNEREHAVLNDRHNIVVISDEAHRSQYGLTAILKKDGLYKFGYAKHMRDALPNASFIGFTGTPIAINERDTTAVFGDYVSIYDIQDAVEDGATVPIYYESRLAKLNLNQEELEELSKRVDEIIEDEDNSQKEKTKSEWSRLEKLVGSTPRLIDIANDIVQHFETRCEVMDGKGMIVGMSREICVHLYNEIIKIRPDWHDDDPTHGAIKIVMTGSSADKPILQPHIYTKMVKKSLEKRFKNPDDPLKLVIVCDMWLTGFDVPCCHTMYVDKPMKGHNLMQAIARVNRVFKDKPGGLIVDYIGIANELRSALKIYTDAKGRGKPTNDCVEAFNVLSEKLDVIRGMFAKSPQSDGFDISGFQENANQLLVPAANYILGLDDGKKRFFDLVLAITKAYSLCSTLDEVKPLRKEIAFYSAIKAALSKIHITGGSFSKKEKSSALKQIVDNALVAEGVTDVFALCGLEKPNIGLLSDEFLEDVRQMPERNLAVELLEKLLADTIKSKVRNNVVQEKKFSDRLLKTLRLYNNRSIETAQVIEELIQMAKDFQNELKKENELGLNTDEIAFYDALANNDSAVRELGDETLKKIAVEITEKLRRSTTVDWQVRKSVRAKLKILVRRTLQRYKYPPDKSADAVELILEQAEVLSNSWSL